MSDVGIGSGLRGADTAPYCAVHHGAERCVLCCVCAGAEGCAVRSGLFFGQRIHSVLDLSGLGKPCQDA